MVTSSKCKQ